MEKKYMVVAYGEKKDTGEPYSRLYRVFESDKRVLGFLDEKDSMYLDDIHPLGEIVTFDVTVKTQ